MIQVIYTYFLSVFVISVYFWSVFAYWTNFCIFFFVNSAHRGQSFVCLGYFLCAGFWQCVLVFVNFCQFRSILAGSTPLKSQLHASVLLASHKSIQSEQAYITAKLMAKSEARSWRVKIFCPAQLVPSPNLCPFRDRGVR